MYILKTSRFNMLRYTVIIPLLIISFVAVVISEESSLYKVARGEVQSCRGCSLNRLPDVKNFIYSDLPKYSGVEFHPIPGAVPHLVLFDESDKELERIDLSSYSRERCNELANKWFTLKEDTISEGKEDSKHEL